jgi:DNA repair exonuclease SbcCD ATPase subunit
MYILIFLVILLYCFIGGTQQDNVNTTATNQQLIDMEQQLVNLQAVLKDVLQDRAVRQADLDSLHELRQEVQQLKSEIRLANEQTSDNKESSNAAVLEDWVKGSVVELREEVREVERRLEEDQEVGQSLHQLQDREAGVEKRLDSIQSLVVATKV